MAAKPEVTAAFARKVREEGVGVCHREALSPLELEAQQNFVASMLENLAADPDLLVDLPEEKRREFLGALLAASPNGLRLQVVSLSDSTIELRLACSIPSGCLPSHSTRPLFEEV